MATMKAIETHYKGYKFRSRLEARWAVLLDTMDVKWEYEKEGYDLGEGIRYLPDFWLPDFDFWIEVKGDELSQVDWIKIRMLEEKSGHDVVIAMNLPDLDFSDSPRIAGKEYSITFTEYELEQMVLRMFTGKDASTMFSGSISVLCPVCSFDYVHLGTPEHREGHDNYEAGWEGRGDAVWLPMYCEQGHQWKLRFGFHKGNLFASVTDVVEEEHDLLMVLTDRDPELRRKAILAARQARFEHGEKG